jgi:D-sedoheptulose 7-phosphate isomerase
VSQAYKPPEELLLRFAEDNPDLARAGCAEQLRRMYGAMRDGFAGGGKLLLCGNGGSAADCEHIAGELMKGFLLKRPAPAQFASHASLTGGEGAKLQGALPAIPLTGMPSLSTAYANDADPHMVFAQQVYGLGRAGDMLLGISTSGDARNVCSALRVARAIGMRTFGMAGRGGGEMLALCDVCALMPSDETYRVQEQHLPFYHALCAMLEAAFFFE